MEENLGSGIIRIVIIGPESTGKTELSKALASVFQTSWVPEYAREYIEGLNRPYTLSDVLHIAEEQVKRDKLIPASASKFLFVDTDLIITKVWLDLVYNCRPAWIPEYLKAINTGLYLLCKPDIPWIPDPVRENGGAMREILFERYRSEIESIGCEWKPVEGLDSNRLSNAVQHIQARFPVTSS
jgi:NadR type nicotinamide-nucleotide adenylyltransferase